MPHPLSRFSRLPRVTSVGKPKKLGSPGGAVSGIHAWEHRVDGGVNGDGITVPFLPQHRDLPPALGKTWGPGNKTQPSAQDPHNPESASPGQMFNANRQMEAETEPSTPRTHLEGG